MCSIGEDDFGDEGGDHAMTVDPKINSHELPDELCKKCNQDKVVVKLNLKEAQCRACFFTFVRHKFRAALGSTRIVDRGARVLLVFDTSVESCIMFDIIRFALREDQFKRLNLVPFAVFIDDSWLNSEVEDNTYIKRILHLLKYFAFESHYVDISSPAVVHRIADFDCFTVPADSSDSRNKFRNTLNACNSLTSRQDFVHHLRDNIVRDVAKKLNCKCAFLPVISAEIAATLLANVSLGRGSSVADDIAFCDSRQPNEVKLLRPIRTLLNIEVETYTRLNTDVAWPAKSISYLARSSEFNNASIQNLTMQFVDGLQENFASTVSTVFRTGDKISAAAASLTKQSAGQRCKFCHSALDYKDSPTLFAIEYSRCVSANAGKSDINDAALMGRLADEAVLGITNEDDTKLFQNLCHGCRNIFSDLNDDGQLAKHCI